MSGTSSVGQASVYEAGDQRNSKDSEINTADRFHEGKENSHNANDPSMSFARLENLQTVYRALIFTFYSEDQRSIANKLAREVKV